MNEILIIDEQFALRRGLASIVMEKFPIIHIYQIDNSEAERFLKDHHNVDLIVFDPTATDRKLAFQEFTTLKALSPNSTFLLHSGYRHNEFDLPACLLAGASGFLSKTASLSEYLLAASRLLKGKTYLNKRVRADLRIFHDK